MSPAWIRPRTVNDPLVYCWCLGCGVVRVEREPLPFCRHNIESTLAHPAQRMVPLPDYHPFANDLAEMDE